jgi:hypothetical protein
VANQIRMGDEKQGRPEYNPLVKEWVEGGEREREK